MTGDNPVADIYGSKSLGAVSFQKLHSNVRLGKDKYQPDICFNN